MGLDISHGCWHGAYSAFMRWRELVAQIAGYPPLSLMDGFFTPGDWWFMTARPEVNNPTMYRLSDPEPSRRGWSHAILNAFNSLPIPWTLYEHDPLTKLLNHSDSDGSIACADCGPLADRLAEIMTKAPDEDLGGHVGSWHAKTQKFIDGLRAAVAAGEDITFS